MSKDPQAFRTIGELSDDLGVAQHILRYWETKFPELSPLKRAGNRRYYRPADVATARTIDRLVNREGYTLKGAQKALKAAVGDDAPSVRAASPSDLPALKALAERMRRALDA